MELYSLLGLSSSIALLALVVVLRKKRNTRCIESVNWKHVFITGGSSGIRLAMVKVCLEQGAFVTLVARNLPRLLQAKDSLIASTNCLPQRILIKAMDVSKCDEMCNAIEEAFKWRPIDVLVCNAAVLYSRFFEEVDTTQLEELFKINLMGCVYPIHVALPLIKQRSASHPSSIVLVNFVSGLTFCSGMQVYSPIKYAQRGFADTLRMELSPYNIQVSLAFPYFTKTPMLSSIENMEDMMRKWFDYLHWYNEEEAKSAKEVAIAIVEGFKKGEHTIPIEISGYFPKILSRGIAPSNSIVKNVAEALFLIPFRSFSFILSWEFSRIMHDPKFSKLFPCS